MLLSWVSLGFFTGIAFHLVAGDGMEATGKVIVAIAGAVIGGLALGLVASRVLPNWAIFTTLLPAVGGAMLALYAYRVIAGRQK